MMMPKQGNLSVRDRLLWFNVALSSKCEGCPVKCQLSSKDSKDTSSFLG